MPVRFPRSGAQQESQGWRITGAGKQASRKAQAQVIAHTGQEQRKPNVRAAQKEKERQKEVDTEKAAGRNPEGFEGKGPKKTCDKKT